MANSFIILADLKAGRCSNTVKVRLLRFWEARNPSSSCKNHEEELNWSKSSLCLDVDSKSSLHAASHFKIHLSEGFSFKNIRVYLLCRALEDKRISSWWMVDLGEDDQFDISEPNQLTIVGCILCATITLSDDGSSTYARSWKFQGSVDRKTWTDLRTLWLLPLETTLQ
ncbi:hypothetical protein YC2023_013031 [Brassica napus]